MWRKRENAKRSIDGRMLYRREKPHSRTWNILNIDEYATTLCHYQWIWHEERLEEEEEVQDEIERRRPRMKQQQVDRFHLFILEQADPSHLANVTGGTFDLPEKKKPCQILNIFGKKIQIEQGFSDISKGHSELVWEASLHLPKFFERHKCISLKGKRVLELGSGTGMCGIAVAASGADVILTDQERALPLLRKNCDQNVDSVAPGTLSVRALYWGHEPHHHDLPKFDVILASDCLYSNAAWTSFQNTLFYVMSENPNCVAYVCNDGRWDVRFFHALRRRFDFVCLDENTGEEFDLPTSISSRLLVVRIWLKKKEVKTEKP